MGIIEPVFKKKLSFPNSLVSVEFPVPLTLTPPPLEFPIPCMRGEGMDIFWNHTMKNNTRNQFEINQLIPGPLIYQKWNFWTFWRFFWQQAFLFTSSKFYGIFVSAFPEIKILRFWTRKLSLSFMAFYLFICLFVYLFKFIYLFIFAFPFSTFLILLH